MHYYNFDIKAYHHATTHLTNDEDLCYRRMLDMAYDTETPIKRDGLERKLRSTAEVIDAVLMEFFTPVEEGWTHRKVTSELEKTYAKSQKARESALTRHKSCERTANALRTLCERTANAMLLNTQDSELNTKEEKTVAVKPQPTSKLTDAEWFESIKGNYPHIDVENESRKMDAWLSTRRGKQKTRRFVVNWLNRIDAPMQATVSTLPAEYAF
jgi:uncharacterized protein YdaU (DUF1376 family)